VSETIQSTRLSERLHIAEQLIESVKRESSTSESEAKESEMSLTIERETERKPMFGAIKRAVLGMPTTNTHVSSKKIERIAETPHQKVFRFIAERRIDEATAIAARLINAGDVDGFFIYGGTNKYRRAEDWYSDRVAATRRGQSISEIENLTPEMAQVIIRGNESNRRVKVRNLRNLVRDILAGAWDYNGETIKVSKDGLLNDGQNRSFSVLLAGEAIRTLVVFGLDRESRRTVDIGEKRTAADRAGMRGVKDHIVVTAIAALAFELDNGRQGTAAEIDAYLGDHAEDIYAANGATGSSIKGVGPSITGTTALYLMRLGADSASVKKFFKIVRDNENTSSGDAARTVHRALFPNAGHKPPLRMKKLEWVSTLSHHYILWKRKKTTHQVVIGKELPESI
jgi:hypothetical protein